MVTDIVLLCTILLIFVKIEHLLLLAIVFMNWTNTYPIHKLVRLSPLGNASWVSQVGGISDP